MDRTIVVSLADWLAETFPNEFTAEGLETVDIRGTKVNWCFRAKPRKRRLQLGELPPGMTLIKEPTSEEYQDRRLYITVNGHCDGVYYLVPDDQVPHIQEVVDRYRRVIEDIETIFGSVCVG